MLDIKGPEKCNYNEMIISWCFPQWHEIVTLPLPVLEAVPLYEELS